MTPGTVAALWCATNMSVTFAPGPACILSVPFNSESNLDSSPATTVSAWPGASGELR